MKTLLKLMGVLFHCNSSVKEIDEAFGGLLDGGPDKAGALQRQVIRVFKITDRAQRATLRRLPEDQLRVVLQAFRSYRKFEPKHPSVSLRAQPSVNNGFQVGYERDGPFQLTVFYNLGVDPTSKRK